MIFLNGKEVAPQKIKRIQLGDRIVYIRRSKLGGETEFELAMQALINNVAAVPLEINPGFLLELASSPDMELHIIASDISEVDMGTGFGIEPEIYVELTAPMKYDKPIVFVFETEASATKAAICEMEEQIPVIFEAEANAPKTAKTDTSEKFEVDLDFVPEANSANSVLLEKEFEVFALKAEAEIRPAATGLVEEQLKTDVEIYGKAEAAGTAFTEAGFGTKIEIEAELWIKPGEWINPVLKNNVLGIVQAMSTVQNGSVLKIC